MDIIVLAKYVADVEDVPPDAWDLETGTLKRGRLRMVTNPLDSHALRLARDLKAARGGTVVVLSMGPESAERVCRRALAYGADEAVLITDRAFAGADTLATARVLAAAVGAAQSAFGLRDPLILAGMQSPDGDTAQVPAELASLLRLPLLPYVTAVDPATNPLHLRCLETRGHADYLLHAPPALATVTSYTAELPFYTALQEMLRASEATVHRWGAEQLNLSPEQVGLAGSATRVVNIESVSSRRERRCTISLEDSRQAAGEMARLVQSLDSWFLAPRGEDADDRLPSEASGPPATDAAGSLSEGRPVFSIIEEGPEGPTTGSLELLGTARALADRLGVPAVAVLLRGGAATTPAETDPTVVAATLTRAGAHRLLVVAATEATVGHPPHHLAAHLLLRAAEAKAPQIILAPASPAGRVLAPLAAAPLGAGLTADCTGLSIEDYHQRKGDRIFRDVLHQARPALGGNILATIVSVNGRNGAPQMATVRAGVFQQRSFPSSGGATVEELRVAPAPEMTSLRRIPGADRAASGAQHPAGSSPAGDERVPNNDAAIVVSVGIGIGSRDRVESLVRPLIAAMARRWNLPVSLACSRAVVEARILPYSYQIGQTGRTVRPELYVALGISGAIQHRLGMQGSGAVLAVNPDAEAEIMAISDFAVLGTLEEALPLFVRELKKGASAAE